MARCYVASKVEALWKRMAEMFGAEALARKYGDTPPDTWITAVERLNQFELERGMRRLVYGGKTYVPTLPEFLRMCREIGGEQWNDVDNPRVPAARHLEHKPQPRWDREGCEHLLAYLTRRDPSRNRLDVQPLVNAKNAWAEDMRDAEMSGSLPKDNGKEWWFACMAHAEDVVARVSKAA
jgi:hypothetical protein